MSENITVAMLNSSMTTKKWYLGTDHDDLTHELEFHGSGSFIDLKDNTTTGRWEAENNGTTP